MQVGKPPMIDAAPGTDPAAAAQGATARQGAAAVPAPDRADIRPLSVAAALQILIAEVLDQWSLPPSPALSPTPALSPSSSAPPDGAPDAAMRLVQAFLQSLPAADAGTSAFIAADDRLLAGLVQGMDQATRLVAAWRDVPREAIDALGQTRAMVLGALGEEPPDPTLSPWVVRPEWLDLAPRIELLRRRRRWARRRLLDPDLPLPGIDDERNA